MEEKLPPLEIARRINKKLKCEAVKIASDSYNSYVVRRPCGIFSIDIASGGGLPAGTMVEIAGPEGAGKNLLADLYLAETQRIYGDEFRAFILTTEYKYDKLRGLQNGVKISLSDKEIRDLETARGEPFEDEERARLTQEVGTFLLLEEEAPEKLLDAAIDIMRHGDFQIGVIDSLATLIPEEEQLKDMDESDKMAARASLQTKFMNKAMNCFKQSNILLLGLNQVRAPIGYVGRYVPAYKISEACAVKHGIAGRIEISSGSKILEEKTKERLGKELKWHLSKGKAGFHEGPSGVLKFYYSSGIDVFEDFIDILTPYCSQAGSWYELSMGMEEPRRFHGRGAMMQELRNEPELVAKLKKLIYQDRGIVCMNKEPDEKQEEASGEGGEKARKGRGRKSNP